MAKTVRINIRMTEEDLSKLKDISKYIEKNSPFSHDKPFNISLALRSAIRFAHALLVK